MKVAVVGGGAAGFFSAIQVKENYTDAQVDIFEKSNKVLAKVKVSGGGRCNVTNGATTVKSLLEGYPRGKNLLKKAFYSFNNIDIQNWFKAKGVQLKTEKDSRVFPVSNNSQTIIDCFHKEIHILKIEIHLGKGIEKLQRKGEEIILHTKENQYIYDKVIITTGGSPKKEGFYWLEELGHKIEKPVPSLFTFKLEDKSVTKLMGLVASNAIVNIQGTKLKTQGPVLITHWGLSGPAILKLSSFGAQILNEKNYDFKAQINWVGIQNEQSIQEQVSSFISQNPNKSITKAKPFDLPERLWIYLLGKSEIPQQKLWSELGKKGLNKLSNTLSNDIYSVKGKTTFKEEFVTCGGISLESIHSNSMKSKVCDQLYFAGEVVNIDGITGGYNFQSAWTTAFIAGKLL